MTAPRQQRALRATAAATLATFVALLSHVAAGGAPPSALGALLPWALSLLVSLVGVGRRLSLARLGAAVTASQVIFHTMFVLGVVPLAGSTASAAALTGSSGAHSLHAGHMSLPASLSSPAGIAAAMPDVAMLAAHLAAAIITTALLHRGERLLAGIVDLARRVAVRLRAVAADVVPRSFTPVRTRVAAVDHRVRHPRPLVASPARRGPPVLLAH